jgi:CBS domain-containing protein
MKVKHFMIPKDEIITVRRTTNLKEAAQVMIENNIGSLLVVDCVNNPVGFVTKTDFVRAFLTGESNQSIEETLVCEIMQCCDLLYINEDSHRDAAAQIMHKHNKHHLLVVTKVDGQNTITATTPLIRGNRK